MDLVEAILSRKSIRAFRSDPVPRKILEEILEAAIHAPSWANTQPWEFVVVGGEKLTELKRALASKIDEVPSPDLPRLTKFPDPYGTRRRVVGRKILEMKGIVREDKAKRRWWRVQMTEFFGAPDAIIICIDRSFSHIDDFVNVWALVSCGFVAMNITLLAMNHGMGTCVEVAPVAYPDVIRDVLDIPDFKLMVMAVAIGYPDWDDPVNQFRSEREPVERITKWYGFV